MQEGILGNPKVTIIMPSLNVADYIRPCMDSVVGQTLTDIEIIAVDAGSVDGTLEILREYAEKDSRIQVVESEKKSYGYQLNMGIALARGKYIGVVETDDIATPDMCEALYCAADETGADYAKGVGEGFFTSLVGDDIRYSMKILPQEQYDACEGKVMVVPREMPQLVLLDYYVWNGIYRREFVQGIRLNETAGAAYQDIGFMLQAHCSAAKAVYMDKLVYYYRRNSVNSSCGYHKKIFRYLVQEYRYADLLLQGKMESWRRVCAHKMFWQVLSRFQTMAQSGEFWEEALPDMRALAEMVKSVIENGTLEKTDLTEEEWGKAMCLLESPQSLYDACARPIRDKIHAVRSMLYKIGNRTIVIFGCGKMGRFLHVLLGNRKPGQVVAYCDSHYEEMREPVQGICVLGPEKAFIEYPEAVYVIASRYYAEEMKEKLCSLGIREENILIYTAGIDRTLQEVFLTTS